MPEGILIAREDFSYGVILRGSRFQESQRLKQLHFACVTARLKPRPTKCRHLARGFFRASQFQRFEEIEPDRLPVVALRVKSLSC